MYKSCKDVFPSMAVNILSQDSECSLMGLVNDHLDSWLDSSFLTTLMVSTSMGELPLLVLVLVVAIVAVEWLSSAVVALAWMPMASRLVLFRFEMPRNFLANFFIVGFIVDWLGWQRKTGAAAATSRPDLLFHVFAQMRGHKKEGQKTKRTTCVGTTWSSYESYGICKSYHS